MPKGRLPQQQARLFSFSSLSRQPPKICVLFPLFVCELLTYLLTKHSDWLTSLMRMTKSRLIASTIPFFSTRIALSLTSLIFVGIAHLAFTGESVCDLRRVGRCADCRSKHYYCAAIFAAKSSRYIQRSIFSSNVF